MAIPSPEKPLPMIAMSTSATHAIVAQRARDVDASRSWVRRRM
jgi:hypothetical protein